jgi:hypothetical protein
LSDAESTAVAAAVAVPRLSCYGQISLPAQLPFPGHPDTYAAVDADSNPTPHPSPAASLAFLSSFFAETPTDECSNEHVNWIQGRGRIVKGKEGGVGRR